MAHFAKVNNSIVEQVIVADQAFVDTYIDGLPGDWVKTSYNTRSGIHHATEPSVVNTDGSPTVYPADSTTPLRKNFASIGDTYDLTRDAFYRPQPYASWTLVEDTCQWAAPITYPDDNKSYVWDEIAYQANNNTGWVEVV